MIMLTYVIIVATLVLVFGTIIHLLYKPVFSGKRYRGITIGESLLIIFGSIPGLAGCAAGWSGFGFPLPLIVGLPLQLAFIGSEDCGWSQSLIFDDPYLTHKFASFPVAWAGANFILLGLLYFLKLRANKNSVNRGI